MSDVLGEILDRDAGLHTPDVALAEHLLKGMSREGDSLIF
jgi:hypothetical protein